MKKKLIFLALPLCLILLACGRVNIKEAKEATLSFHYAQYDITEALTEEELVEVIDILDGKTYSPDPSDPSCGFSEDISITIQETTYAIARDSCGIIKNCKNGKYFNISEDERKIIEEIFANHGGFFPCV